MAPAPFPGSLSCKSWASVARAARWVGVHVLLSPSREEGDSHSLALVYPAGEFILPFFILLLVSLVPLINHPQMHLTISWHFKSIDFKSLVTSKMGN